MKSLFSLMAVMSALIASPVFAHSAQHTHAHPHGIGAAILLVFGVLAAIGIYALARK